MRKFLLTSLISALISPIWAQSFSAGGGVIPDNGPIQTCFPLSVSGIGNISSSLGLSSVSINISHTWIAQLEIYLRAPDGSTVPLSIQNGGSGNNYTATCFSGTANTALENGAAPFTGNYIPDGYLGIVNNGQNGDGVWNLCVKDIATGDTGSVTGWSLNFTTGLPPAPPSCNGYMTPGNTCADATPVCSFYGFCSATSTSYTADTWPELDTAFCGTVQNNAFVKFIATGYEMNFNVWVTSSTQHDGIQLLFFDGGCGAGPVTSYGCYSPIRPGASPSLVSATGLTTGNTYYLMIDGFAGDECNYMIEPVPATGGLAISADTTAVCPGNSVHLTSSGGNGIYSWTGPGLNSNTGSMVTATPINAASYYVSSIDPGGMCPVTKQVNIQVLALPAPPTVTDTVKYCRGVAASALMAYGNNLLWYNSATGGVGFQQAIIPTTPGNGLTTYYVSQTIGCESPRAVINVLIKETPSLGTDKQVVICNGKAANLTSEFDTRGLSFSWSFNHAVTPQPSNVSTGGTYSLEVINRDGCADTAHVYLIIQPPVFVFAGNDTIAVKGIPHQLHSTAAATYTWSPAWLLNDPHTRFPVATLAQDQQFIVNITDEAGCTGSDSIMVKVIKGTTYYIPTAFTPNGDGLNDVFYAVPAGIARTLFFRIMDRYGKKIFETDDPFNKGWNGTFMGLVQSSGGYVWVIKGVDVNGRTIEMKGTVLLIK